jgi:hypothetical protein
VDGLGVIGLVAGLWIALSFPPQPDGGRDRTELVLSWLLVVFSVLLLASATLEPPAQS